MVRTGPAACTLVETQPPILRRCSVSYIRDLARGSYDHSQTEGSRDARIREGNIIHSILENWNDGDAVDRIYGDMGKDAAAHLIPVIDSFVTSELGKKLLSAKEYLSEHSFAFKEGAMIISGRIDRINIYDDHVWVVDYKRSTNEKELEGYKAQLACYLKFAERAFPGKKVTGSIIDITECREYAFGSNDLAITV